MSDRFHALLTEAILERDQPRTADLFFRMLRRDGHSLGDALGVVTAAEAPFVQVPSHINLRDGQITLVNNDHTILGLRTSASLAPLLPEPYRLLPLLQSVWYIPAGLDIWNQFLMANFVNDAARANKLVAPVLERECAGLGGLGGSRPPQLEELDEAILAFDVPRATALARAYLASGADRRPYLTTVAITACKFQDDPHNQKITHSTFEEYGANSTHLRDRLLLAAVRLLAGWPKMPGERECYARFMKDWIN